MIGTYGPDGKELVPNLGTTVGKTKGFLHHIGTDLAFSHLNKTLILSILQIRLRSRET